MEEPVRALGQLDERSERGRLDHLARESVPHLGLLGHRLDPRDAGVHQGAARRVHLDGAVVLDVDVRLELLRERPDRLPALADQGADLLGVDLDLLDPRRVRRQLLPRPWDRFAHRLEDEQPSSVSLLERVAQDVERDAGDLDVHLEGGDVLRGAGDLEVHVTEVILDARDVGEHDVVLALLDQSHGDAGHGVRHRHPGRHQRHGGGANRAHRGGAVRLQRLRDNPDHVGEILLARDRGPQGAFRERAVADVATLGAAHEAHFPDRERREVVVMPEGLGFHQAEVVDPHVHAARPQGDVGEDLRLAAGEESGPVNPRRDPDLAFDRPDLVLGSAVGPFLVDRDPATNDLLLELVEGT